MNADAITSYRQQMARAKRNFALCVVSLQNTVTPEDAAIYVWRNKSDHLRSAIKRAERFAQLGNFDAAVTLLSRENKAQ